MYYIAWHKLGWWKIRQVPSNYLNSQIYSNSISFMWYDVKWGYFLCVWSCVLHRWLSEVDLKFKYIIDSCIMVQWVMQYTPSPHPTADTLSPTLWFVPRNTTVLHWVFIIPICFFKIYYRYMYFKAMCIFAYLTVNKLNLYYSFCNLLLFANPFYCKSLP